jgi:hypothetical protein
MEFERRHLKSFAAAASLLVIMAGLFFIADKAVFGHAIIADTANLQQG